MALLRERLSFSCMRGSKRIAPLPDQAAPPCAPCERPQALLTLGNVIDALCDARRTHVPYRDHVLTRGTCRI